MVALISALNCTAFRSPDIMAYDTEDGVAPLFNDTVTVEKIDNSKFEKVARLYGSTKVLEAKIELDVREDLFSIKQDDKFRAVITDRLVHGRGPVTEEGMMSQIHGSSLFDSADYVMLGVVFKVEDKNDKRIVYVSFGGLLMRIESEFQALQPLELDKRVFILLEKQHD